MTEAAPAAGSPDPETAALDALERADPDAVLSILMPAYGRALYRYCLQLVADRDLAEEVHQMTFVQAYEGLGRFNRRSSLKTWLFSIARHRCLDALKIQRRRWRRFQQVEALPENPDPDVGAAMSLATDDLQNALRDCLGELGPRIRATVLLRFQEEFSYVEMEQICDERAPTLQARVARAMPVLRSCLEGKGMAP